MLFNSIDFLIFFPLVVVLYWILTPGLRTLMLLVASYYFYMNWEPVYALLILLSTVTTYSGGILMDIHPQKKKLWLGLTVALNLSILFLYKYLGFLGDNLRTLMDAMGLGIEIPQFTLLLPVGISFYTFQAVGYLIDVYRGSIKSERSFLTYALFVSFFPQLVAGPIERAKNLLPQFHSTHHFNPQYMIDGFRLMIWGYFMKLCIAESVSSYVDAVYNNIAIHNGKSIWLATFFFTFQIFCDFGGYSLIAIGAAKCMGFDLMQNFRQPYLAFNVKEFWRRWHISLSTWFTDYVYIPLGGNRCHSLRHYRNLMVTFLVSGLWHGANWTFVLWGAYHGVLQVIHAVRMKYFGAQAQPKNKVIGIIGVCVTFFLMMLGWVLFRANNIADAFIAYRKMLHPSGMLFNGEGKPSIVLPLLMICVLMMKEIKSELRLNIRFTSSENPAVSGFWSAIMIFIILLCASFEGGQFIYFQF